MFPLKSNIPVNRFSYGIWLIIFINIAIYIYFYINYYGLLFADYGFMPLKLAMPFDIVSISEKMTSFFSYMFLHSNLLHIIINMYFLYVFGRNVEDYLGTIKFMCMYVILGILAAIVEAFMMPELGHPIIGSNGAVLGIMGMFIVFFPFSKIKTFIFLLIYAIIKNVPAIIIVVLFLLFQISLWYGEQFFNLSDYLLLLQENIGINSRYLNVSNVAYWINIGGFFSGVVIGIFFKIIRKIKYSNI